jgi:hypothetical protein
MFKVLYEITHFLLKVNLANMRFFFAISSLYVTEILYLLYSKIKQYLEIVR